MLQTDRIPQFQDFISKLKGLSLDLTPQEDQVQLDWSAPGQERKEEVRLLPLSDCPLPMPEGWVIAALSSRIEEDLVLSIPAKYYQHGNMPPLVSDSSFYSKNTLYRAYMKSLCSQVTFALKDEGVVTISENITPKEGFHSLPLHWKEFPQRAGAGVLAVIVPGNAKALRRSLNTIHQREVSKLTNIERSLAKRFKDARIEDAGICLREITPGVLHLVIAWPDPACDEGIKRLTLRVSSTLGLLEDAWAQTGLS